MTTSRSAALEAAALAVLAGDLAGLGGDPLRAPSAITWSTGQIELATTRRGRGDYNLLLQILNRLHRRGLVAKHTATATRSAYWRWMPSEGTCDTAAPVVPLDCSPSWCMRPRGGCWQCTRWSRVNLGLPMRPRP